MSCTAKEGLYGVFAMGNIGTALLTGCSLRWRQTKRRFYPSGSILPTQVLRGVIEWTLGFRKAFCSIANLGSFNVGTYEFIGTLYPRGGTNPLVKGTVALNSGSLLNMEAENEAAVVEEHEAMIFNLTFTD